MDTMKGMQGDNDHHHHHHHNHHQQNNNNTDVNHENHQGSEQGYDVVREQDGGMSRHGHGMHGMGHKTDNMEHMHMSATFSLTTHSTFLIEGVKISSTQGIILAVIFAFLVTILFDGLKFVTHWREIHRERFEATPVQNRKKSLGLFVTSFSHMISVSLAYIMMLCIMTMNVWLMVSVVLGSGIGHFVMRPLLSWKLKKHLDESKKLETAETAKELMPLNDNVEQGEIKRRSGTSKKVLTVRRSLLIEDNTYV